MRLCGFRTVWFPPANLTRTLEAYLPPPCPRPFHWACKSHSPGKGTVFTSLCVSLFTTIIIHLLSERLSSFCSKSFPDLFSLRGMLKDRQPPYSASFHNFKNTSRRPHSLLRLVFLSYIGKNWLKRGTLQKFAAQDSLLCGEGLVEYAQKISNRNDERQEE